MSMKGIIRKEQKHVYTQGRPPWYSSDGRFRQAFVIGVAGGSASGKTTVTHKIVENLDVPWIVQISTDSFYKELRPDEQALAYEGNYNFDHPNAFDFHLMLETLTELKKGKKVTIPIYDFTKNQPLSRGETVYGADVIFIEGIFALYDPELVAMMDLKIFVDTDDDIRLIRRLERDIKERDRSLMCILHQYHRFVKPSFDEFIRPSMRRADVIIPRGVENQVAIDLITKMVARKLEAHGVLTRHQLTQRTAELGSRDDEPATLIRLEGTNSVRAMTTLIRDRTTNRDDFVFYSKRLTRLIMERCLREIRYAEKTVETAAEERGAMYRGNVAVDRLCGVSILRAGSTMVGSLLQVVKDAALGEILIQTNPETDEAELHQCQLPLAIADYTVILMDATIATGAAALMAIQVLLDHGVGEEQIIFASVIAAIQGVRAVSYAHPRVKMVVAEVDPSLDEQFHILPGVGNYGDRFFGTD